MDTFRKAEGKGETKLILLLRTLVSSRSLVLKISISLPRNFYIYHYICLCIFSIHIYVFQNVQVSLYVWYMGIFGGGSERELMLEGVETIGYPECILLIHSNTSMTRIITSIYSYKSSSNLLHKHMQNLVLIFIKPACFSTSVLCRQIF